MDTGTAFGLLSVGLFLFVWFVVWMAMGNARHDRDEAAAALLRREFAAAAATLSPDNWLTNLPSYSAFTDLRLGEVSRHFDRNTSATITGWLTHNLGFHGWGLGTEVGGLGLGVGRLGLSGSSQVDLSSSGTVQDNLMGDGFVAVFEREMPAGPDTIPLVVPSEQAARELVGAVLDESAARFMKRDNNGRVKVHYPSSLAAIAASRQVLLAFPDEASYASDRLYSALRMPEDARPLISIWGAPLSRHALLGAAIRVGADGPVEPLFPVALLTAIQKSAERAVLVAEQGASSTGSMGSALPGTGVEDDVD